MMQRQKRQNEKGGFKFEKEDWISQLPDEILIRILSLLTVKEAQMSSVLSTRWRYLWTHITCLNFGYNRSPKRSEYIDWVNKVCSLVQSPSIEVFSMISDLDGYAKDNVNKWVDFAMEKGVKCLELDMWICLDDSNRCIFSSGIINKHLRSLNLWEINISGETLEHFLLHCPSLERITIPSLERITIHNSNHLKNLNVGVGGPLLNLKYLDISCCSNLTHLKISAPKLSNFSYYGQEIRLCIENTPLLCHAYIGEDDGDHLTWAFQALSSYLCQLQTLVLHWGLFEFYDRPWIYVDFQQSWKLSSLRELTVQVSGDYMNLLSILLFLEVAPFLEKFRLEIENLLNETSKLLEEMTDESDLEECGELLKEEIVAVHPHQCLNVLEIVGFVASPNLVEFFRHISRVALRLEKVIIDPSPPWKAFGSKCSRILFTKQLEELFEKLLKSVIADRTEFVLLY